MHERPSAAHKLSPLNLSGLMAREVFDHSPDQEAAKAKQRKRAIFTMAYACPECDELHGREDDAEDCCQGEKDAPHDPDDKTRCPVCGSENADAAEASDCCLWKDLDMPTRHAIADRVAAGSTWARELGVWPPVVARA